MKLFRYRCTLHERDEQLAAPEIPMSPAELGSMIGSLAACSAAARRLPAPQVSAALKKAVTAARTQRDPHAALDASLATLQEGLLAACEHASQLTLPPLHYRFAWWRTRALGIHPDRKSLCALDETPAAIPVRAAPASALFTMADGSLSYCCALFRPEGDHRIRAAITHLCMKELTREPIGCERLRMRLQQIGSLTLPDNRSPMSTALLYRALARTILAVLKDDTEAVSAALRELAGIP